MADCSRNWRDLVKNLEFFALNLRKYLCNSLKFCFMIIESVSNNKNKVSSRMVEAGLHNVDKKLKNFSISLL